MCLCSCTNYTRATIRLKAVPCQQVTEMLIVQLLHLVYSATTTSSTSTTVHSYYILHLLHRLLHLLQLQLRTSTTSEILIVQLLHHKAAVEDIDSSVDSLDWWKRHEQTLPNWCSALVQPTSAAAERVFSLLQNSFSQRQSTSSLEDYIETSIIYVG